MCFEQYCKEHYNNAFNLTLHNVMTGNVFLQFVSELSHVIFRLNFCKTAKHRTITRLMEQKQKSLPTKKTLQKVKVVSYAIVLPQISTDKKILRSHF